MSGRRSVKRTRNGRKGLKFIKRLEGRDSRRIMGVPLSLGPGKRVLDGLYSPTGVNILRDEISNGTTLEGSKKRDCQGGHWKTGVGL